MKVLINLNDEAGVEFYSVEPAHDVGNWLNSFPSMVEALQYIRANGFEYDNANGFRDTRSGK